MISPSEWQNIRQVVANAQRAAMYCSIATVNPQGFPSITPIGTVFLDQQSNTGFFLIPTPPPSLKIYSISHLHAFKL